METNTTSKGDNMSEFGSTTGMKRGEIFFPKALAAETSSTTHGSFSSIDQGSLVVIVKVTAASGTTPTLTVVVEGSDDGTNWFKLGIIGSDGYSVGNGSAPANITTTGTLNGAFPNTQFVRTRSVVAGTTPSFTYSVSAHVG